MIVKREHKINYVLIFLIVLIASYFTLRVCTLVEQNGGDFKVDYLNEALNTIYKFNTPLIINTQTIGISIFVGFMTFVIIFNYQLSIKKNIQENTYGSSDWETPDTIKKFRQYFIFVSSLQHPCQTFSLAHHQGWFGFQEVKFHGK